MATFDNLCQPSDFLPEAAVVTFPSPPSSASPSPTSSSASPSVSMVGKGKGHAPDYAASPHLQDSGIEPSASFSSSSSSFNPSSSSSSRPSSSALLPGSRSGSRASPLPTSPPPTRSQNSCGPYSDYLESFQAATASASRSRRDKSRSRSSNHAGDDLSITRSSSVSPDYSCLPKEKIQFILSLKEELKKHNTIPDSFNKLGFFEEVSKLLEDEVWEIRNEATLLVLDLLPYLKSNLDTCMVLVLPNLVANLGSSEVRLQEATLQLLSAHLSVTRDKDGLVGELASHGVNHKCGKVSKLAIHNMAHLLSDQLVDVNLSPLVQALYGKVEDSEVGPAVVRTLATLQKLLGPDKFSTNLPNLTTGSRERLDKLLDDAQQTKLGAEQDKGKEQKIDVAKWTDDKGHMNDVATIPPIGKEKNSITNTNHSRRKARVHTNNDDDDDDDDVVLTQVHHLPPTSLEFGVVDAAIMEKIRRPVSTECCFL